MGERDSSPSGETRLFSDTLSASHEQPRVRHGLSAPLGLAAHAVALTAIVVVSLFSVPEPRTPNAPSKTVVAFAPPPPLSLHRGAAAEPSTPIASTPQVEVASFVATPSFIIPDTLLTPTIPLADIPSGATDGFDDGSSNGMAGVVPGGAVGGVPGGLVGGTLGGSGTELPEFPIPDVGPKPLRMTTAMYTEQAARERVTGSVKLRVVIDEQGKVRVLDVLNSIPLLDEEAIRTVESSWRFSPATKNGRPVPCLSDLVVRFTLH